MDLRIYGNKTSGVSLMLAPLVVYWYAIQVGVIGTGLDSHEFCLFVWWVHGNVVFLQVK
jgi:hypothetical protein